MHAASPFSSQDFTSAKIAVLLTTYNGKRFLAAQLDSISAQTYENWHVFCSDDGSTDDSRDIFQHWQKANPEKSSAVKTGPQKGFADNFLSLAYDDNIKADFYAFCDQDDVWHSDKLARAMAWLRTQPAEIPALFCSRTVLIDDTGQQIGHSPLFSKKPGFTNALVQNIAGGNTMVFNDAARRLLLNNKNVSVTSHDWWLYQLVSACDGRVFYDSIPTVSYRQHDHNAIGASTGQASRIARIFQVLNGKQSRRIEQQLVALQNTSNVMSFENRKIFNYFVQSRVSHFIKRLYEFHRSGVFCQTLRGHCMLYLAVMLKRI